MVLVFSPLLFFISEWNASGLGLKCFIHWIVKNRHMNTMVLHWIYIRNDSTVIYMLWQCEPEAVRFRSVWIRTSLSHTRLCVSAGHQEPEKPSPRSVRSSGREDQEIKQGQSPGSCADTAGIRIQSGGSGSGPRYHENNTLHTLPRVHDTEYCAHLTSTEGYYPELKLKPKK